MFVQLTEDERCSVSVRQRLIHAACTVTLAKTMSYNLLLNKAIFFLFFIFLFYWAPEKNSRWILPPSPWWYFDFSFPFPVYHSLIRSPHAVTCSIQLHLLKCPEMLLSIWNIAQTDCGSSSKENISVYCSEIKPLPQVPATISLLCGKKKKKSPTEIANPLLVCSAAVIQRNKIIPVAAYSLGPEMKW